MSLHDFLKLSQILEKEKGRENYFRPFFNISLTQLI